MKRYAFDSTRGEMFAIAHGYYVTVDDHESALAAAVQAEREELEWRDSCAQCGSTLHPPTSPPHCEDCIVDEDHHAAWDDARERFVERPSPAVDVPGVVRTYLRALDTAKTLNAAMPVEIIESAVSAEADALATLRALVAPRTAEESKGEV